jgi:MFS family permease
MNRGDRKIFYGWWIVVASAVGLFWGVPVTVFSFSVFLKPVMQDFHANRAQVSLAYTLAAVVAAFAAPPLGWLIDRYGTRKVILGNTLLFGAALLSARVLSASIVQFYIFAMLTGLFLNGVGPIPYSAVISRWFDRHRGLALGLMMFGIGSGAMLLPSAIQRVIAGFGWRNAYVMLGAAVLLIPLPVCGAILKNDPEDMGLAPDGAHERVSQKISRSGLSAREALGTSTFWLMLVAFSLVALSVQGCMVHTAAMFADRGTTAQTAALASSLIGAALMLGRVGTGYLLDRIFGPRLAAFFFGGAAIGLGLLWLPGAGFLSFAGAFLVGLGLGAEVDIVAFLISRYFGLRCFGEIYSLIFTGYALATAFGPLVMGAGFDRLGSYRPVLALFFAVTAFSAVLITRLGPYRYSARPETESVLSTDSQAAAPISG